MTAKDTAMSYFYRITSGHRNAVRRPERTDARMEQIDRVLREKIEEANNNGDCIINVGFGYFRPIPGDAADELYYKEYKMTEHSRLRKLQLKEAAMDIAFENWRKEAGHGKNEQGKRKAGRKRTCESA